MNEHNRLLLITSCVWTVLQHYTGVVFLRGEANISQTAWSHLTNEIRGELFLTPPRHLNGHKLMHTHTHTLLSENPPPNWTCRLYLRDHKSIKRRSDFPVFQRAAQCWNKSRPTWAGLSRDEIPSSQTAWGPIRLLLAKWMDHLKLVKLHSGRMGRSQV